MEISKICKYITSRIDSASLDVDNYISTENMMQNRGGVISASKVPKENAIEFKPGDILVSNIRPYFKKIWFADRYGGCSSDVLCIRALEGTDSVYLYYLLSQDTFFDHVMSGAKGCKMPRGDKNQIMRWEVDLPDIKEQKRIGQMLKSIDDKILLNNQINHNLEEQAQALYKSWFVDFEPFRGGNFVDSKLGLIPEGWRVGQLSEICEIVGGGTPSKVKTEYYTNNGIHWLTPKDLSVSCKKFTSRGLDDITELGYKSSSAKLMPKGAVLFSSRAPIGYLTIAKNTICTNQGFKSAVPGIAGTAFLYYYLKFNTEYINNLASGSTFKEASGSLMKSLAVVIPPKTVFDKFEDVMARYFDSQENIELENSHHAKVRDLLLSRLMSGELKINDLTC